MVARRKSASKLFSSARLALACNRAPPAPGCGSALQRSVRAGLRLKTARTPAVGRWFNQASPRRRPAAGATGGGQRDLVGRPRSAGRRDPPEVERGRGQWCGRGAFRRIAEAVRQGRAACSPASAPALRKGHRRREVRRHQAGKWACRGVCRRPFPPASDQAGASPPTALGRRQRRSAVMAAAGFVANAVLAAQKECARRAARAMIPASWPAPHGRLSSVWPQAAIAARRHDDLRGMRRCGIPLVGRRLQVNAARGSNLFELRQQGASRARKHAIAATAHR
jgi:hypothetical protein